MDHIRCSQTNNGLFFYKIVSDPKVKPKDICIKQAIKSKAEFVIEKQTNEKHREFGYYKSLDNYISENGYKNIHAYEILYRECKLYFDIEYTNNDNQFINDILKSIKKHFKAFFKMDLIDDNIYISSASGIGESASFKDVQKHSYHIVINNGYYFHSNQDIKRFVNFISDQESNNQIVDAIDKCVYGKNQSFKFPYQSKYGSIRVQKILKGNLKQHLINKYTFDDFKGYYKYDDTIIKQKDKIIANVGVIHENVIFDHNIDITSVNELLNVFGNENYDWDIYYKIACVLKNENVSFEIFNNWAKLSSKYVSDDAYKLFNSLTPKKGGYNLTTLKNMVNQKYPKLLKNKTEKYLDSITVPTINFEKYNYETFYYSQRYCKSIVDIVQTYDTVVLKSHLGTGKTTVICDLIKANDFKSILCITPRVMFAYSMFASLKQVEPLFKLYKTVDKKDRIDCDFIVCQLESLTTIKDDYDCVIFDESESNFAQFNSSTIKNFNEITKKFKTIMSNAKNVICSDAFINNRTLCLIDQLRPNKNKIYIENTYQPYDRKAFNVGHSDDKMCEFMKHFIKKNPTDRNIISTSSRKNSDKLINLLPADGKTLLINSNSSDKVAKELQDVNSLWDQYQNVIYTSSITVGVNYNSGYNFDNLFLHFSVYSCVVRDMFQASLRARYINNNTLYYTNVSKFFANPEDRYRIFEFSELKDIIQDRNNYVHEDQQLEDWVLNLWAYNKLEYNINSFYHEQLINRYLGICGYKIDDTTIFETENEKFEFNIPYTEINDITFDEFDKIYKRMVSGDASYDDKMKYIKFDFTEKYTYENDPILLGSMWETYITRSQKVKNIIFNVKLELGIINEDEIVSVYQDNKEQKLASINKLKAVLGIENSYEIYTISKDTLQESVKYINDNRKLFKNTWGLKINDGSLSDKAVIGLIHQIFNGWCGSEFKRGKQQRKMVKGVREDTSGFELKPSEDMQPFIDAQINRFDKGCVIEDED